MTDSLIELKINSIFPKRRRCAVACEKLLRDIPGKRKVYQGSFEGQAVVIKVYEDRFGAKQRLKKEWQGIEKLHNRDMNSPSLHFYGQGQHGQWCMVTEYLNNSVSAIEIFRNSKSIQEKIDVLEMIFKKLAKLHNTGVIQKDLHLGNFLVAAEKVYAIDAAKMTFGHGPVSKRRSLMQLGIISSYMKDELKSRLPELLEKYAQVRKCLISSEEQIDIEKYARQHLRAEIRRQLRKNLRTSSRHIKLWYNFTKAVFDKTFYNKLNAPYLMDEIDRLMEDGQVIKRGNTCFVSRIKCGGKDVVVKRYNHKSLFHSLRITLKRSRARKSWLNAHHLIMLDVDTPKPLAYIVKFKGPIIWESYIFTEYIEGRKFAEILTNKHISEEMLANFKNAISSVLKKLHDYRITHGDVKASNVIVADDKIYLTDLDAMRCHWTGPVFTHRKKGDLERLELDEQ